MASSQNERLLLAAEIGDRLTVIKLLKKKGQLDLNVLDRYPLGESALSKAAKGKLRVIVSYNRLARIFI